MYVYVYMYVIMYTLYIYIVHIYIIFAYLYLVTYVDNIRVHVCGRPWVWGARLGFPAARAREAAARCSTAGGPKVRLRVSWGIERKRDPQTYIYIYVHIHLHLYIHMYIYRMTYILYMYIYICFYCTCVHT